MEKGCKICHAPTQELDAEGRCQLCRIAKAASDAGMTYGKYTAAVGSTLLVAQAPRFGAGRCACDYCARPFFPKSQRQRFCSPACSEAGHRAAAKSRYREKTGRGGPRLCAVCGDEIPGEVSWNVKTCCPKCREIYSQRKRREKYLRNIERKWEKSDDR